MPHMQKVSVALTGEQVAALEAAVEAGEYATTGEIVREALRDWQFKQELRRKDVERLRRLWDEGKASGPAEPLDWEHTLAVARARLKEIVAENDARPSIAAIAPP
jgi:antitoxin ParD1/3/4